MASRSEDGAVVLPAHAETAAVVRRMFGAIAPRYDLLNHLLSLNSDRRWRRRAVDVLLQGATLDGTYLDACAGTLDFAQELVRRPSFSGRVLAADFTPEMLERGKGKADGAPLFPAAGDTLALPVRDASMDGATVGFGVRNLSDLDAGLRELVRVLRPGAKLVILEFTTPSWQPFRGIYLFYFRQVLPRIGRMISSHGTAYSYLPASVLEFPDPPELAERMRSAGLRDVTWETRTGGIVAIHSGVRA